MQVWRQIHRLLKFVEGTPIFLQFQIVTGCFTVWYRDKPLAGQSAPPSAFFTAGEHEMKTHLDYLLSSFITRSFSRPSRKH